MENDHPKIPRKDTFECMISKMVAVDGFSFRSITTSSTLRHLFLLEGRELPKSANTAREVVLAYATQIRSKIANEIQPDHG